MRLRGRPVLTMNRSDSNELPGSKILSIDIHQTYPRRYRRGINRALTIRNCKACTTTELMQ
jgi:hypothetical protein